MALLCQKGFIVRQYGQYSSAPYVTVNPVGGIGAQVVRAHNAIEKKVWVPHIILRNSPLKMHQVALPQNGVILILCVIFITSQLVCSRFA